MQSADLVIFSSAVFDAVHDTPFPGGVAIRQGKILSVGSRSDVAACIGGSTVVKEFHDSLVMPGFFEGHGHFQTSAIREYGPCIRYLEDCPSEEAVVDGVRQYLAQHPDCKRVHGRCWMICSWGAYAPFPTKASLDHAFPDLPVYLIGSNGHVSWLNSAAIRECDLARIVAEHPEWPADYAPRDASGAFTGYLAENASYTIRYMVEQYSDAEYARCERLYQDLLTSYGITGFTDASCLPPESIPAYLAPLRQLEEENALHLHFQQWCGFHTHGDSSTARIQDELNTTANLRTQYHSDRLRIAGAKVLLDGVPDSHTAAMLEPYADAPGIRGELLTDPENYKAYFTLANRMGLSVKCHCLGDRSVRAAIDGFEASCQANGADPTLRNAIEHMNLIQDTDIRRMKELDIIASVQPAHLVDWFNGCGEQFYGHARSLMDSRYRTLIDAGVRIAVGTDTPVVNAAPLRTVYVAVTRKNMRGVPVPPNTPGEAMTLSEVLRGYTYGAAYANNMEGKTGTLSVGKYADIAVIDRNLFAIPPDEIKDCRNICTIFQGEIIYNEKA